MQKKKKKNDFIEFCPKNLDWNKISLFDLLLQELLRMKTLH
jgi:hypothetical protein